MACTISSSSATGILGPGFFARRRGAREDSEAEQTDGSTASSATEARLAKARQTAGRVNQACVQPSIEPVPPPLDYQADSELDQRKREHMHRRIENGNNGKTSIVTFSPESKTAPVPEDDPTKKYGKGELWVETSVDHKRARRGQTSPHTSSGYASKAPRADAPETKRGHGALGILEHYYPGSTTRPRSSASQYRAPNVGSATNLATISEGGRHDSDDPPRAAKTSSSMPATVDGAQEPTARQRRQDSRTLNAMALSSALAAYKDATADVAGSPSTSSPASQSSLSPAVKSRRGSHGPAAALASSSQSPAAPVNGAGGPSVTAPGASQGPIQGTLPVSNLPPQLPPSPSHDHVLLAREIMAYLDQLAEEGS